jgi:hypothetical protein
MQHEELRENGDRARPPGHENIATTRHYLPLDDRELAAAHDPVG